MSYTTTPARLIPGQEAWRWRVLRASSPRERVHGRDVRRLFRTVHVRCVCGDERVVFERDVLAGRSKGCGSAACRHEHEHEVQMQIERALQQRLDELLRDARRRLEQSRALGKSAGIELAQIAALEFTKTALGDRGTQ